MTDKVVTPSRQRGPSGWMRLLNRWFCRGWHRLPGKEFHLPDGPLILVGNHICGLDPNLIQAAVNRPLCFLMAREYHQSMWYARWLFNATGAIPVNPGGANRYALSEAIRAVREGNALCLFPEGAANPPIPLHKILPGAALIAQETGAPIIPFRVSGVWPFDHIHVWRPFLRRSRARVVIGDPIVLPETVEGRAGTRQCSDAIARAIRRLDKEPRSPKA
ncbi:MAG: lysophospholipid acyltransferase family protein [Mariprofundaceae bacterium]